MLNQGRAIKFLVQRGGSTKAKNAEKQLPIKIATLWKRKEARKMIRLVEKKGYSQKLISPKSNPNRDFKVHLYDWMQERTDRLLRRFAHVEDAASHRVASADFKRIIAEEGFTQVTVEELDDLILRHETNPHEMDYQLFLSGKLFIDKPFLMRAFLSTQRKTKNKKKKKTKKQPAIPIATQSEGPRTAKGNPPLIYVQQHRFVTDTNCFSRDRVPDHLIHDDSAHYMDGVDPQFVHVLNAGRDHCRTHECSLPCTCSASW